MRAFSKWPTAVLMGGALLTGIVIGPTAVNAATAELVRIEGAHGSNEVTVTKSGQLSVDAGLATTKAGQVLTAQADPADDVVVFSGASCAAGGIYKVPSGKALIITGVDFYLYTGTASSSPAIDVALGSGPVAAPCTHALAAGAATNIIEQTQNQVFQPGIPIPAGDAIGLQSSSADGSAEFYGYLVPAGAIPASAGASLPAVGTGEPVANRSR